MWALQIHLQSPHYLLCSVFIAVSEMDTMSSTNVVFLNVLDTYSVTWQEGITCYFTVNPSILPGIRHVVGIFPLSWQSTKDSVVCDWSPMPKDYQPDQPLDNCIQFSGLYCLLSVAALRQGVPG